MWAKGHRFQPENRGPILAEHLVAYAEASGDKNRIHLDPSFASESGFPSVIVHGMLSMSFLGDYLIQFFPETGFSLALFRARFKHVTFPGDILTCQGEVREISDDKEVVVHVWATNVEGELVTDAECRFRVVVPEKIVQLAGS